MRLGGDDEAMMAFTDSCGDSDGDTVGTLFPHARGMSKARSHSPHRQGAAYDIYATFFIATGGFLL